MALYLVNPTVEMTLELFVSQRLEEAMTIQYERIKDRRVRDTFVKRLEDRVESLLSDCMDWDLRPPSEAQLSYATLISTRLGIPLPSEAHSYRFHMALFLETYAPEFRKRAEFIGDRKPESAADAAQQIVNDKLKKDGLGDEEK